MTMTLSVVHVRFVYACGHAALVSLPRVKAESPGQRNERINHEKVAAAQRSCDFCPPVSQPSVASNDLDSSIRRVAAIPAPGPSMIDGIDNAPLQHVGAAEFVLDQEQEEKMTSTTTPPAAEQDSASATPATSPVLGRPKGVFPARKLSDEQERELTRLYAETPMPANEIGQRFGIALTSVARIAQRHGAALRSPAMRRAMASNTPMAIAPADTDRASESEPNPTSQAVQPTAGGPKSTSSTRPTTSLVHRRGAEASIEAPATKSGPVRAATRRPRKARVANSTKLRQFVVTFQAEQTLQAESALDALQQAQARGATEVTSIVHIA